MCGPNAYVGFFGTDSDEVVVIRKLDAGNTGIPLAWKPHTQREQLTHQVYCGK
jgi:hypothetical protein